MPHPASASGFDLSRAVYYHHGRFPPAALDWQRLLAPLRSQEAVVSSRMEGTVSTPDEVLRLEAKQEEEEGVTRHQGRTDALEVLLYGRAIRLAQAEIREGRPLTSRLIRSAHHTLLSVARGAHLSPGGFKSEQNYLADRARRTVLFVPIAPALLADGLDRLFAFIADAGPIATVAPPAGRRSTIYAFEPLMEIVRA